MNKKDSNNKGLIEISGLWANKTKNGDLMFSGTLGLVQILIFKNKYKKEGSKEPDFRLYVSRKDSDVQVSDVQEELDRVLK